MSIPKPTKNNYEQMLRCWNSSASSSGMDFNVLTSNGVSIDDAVPCGEDQATPVANLCSLEQSNGGGEPWPDCADFFKVLSDLEFQLAAPQPGDDYDYLPNLQTSNFPDDELLFESDPLSSGSNLADGKEERSSQDDFDDQPQDHHEMGKTESRYKDQSKGKKAQWPKENGLSDECNLDCSLRKKRCSERRRRKRINAKLKFLQQLIPNSEKRDQASTLDDAIRYIQSLKFQLDVMLKLNGQNQLQGTCLTQTHTSMMSPAYGIGAASQFQRPSGYGLMVPPQSVQIASIPQPHPIVCPPQYYTSAEASGSF